MLIERTIFAVVQEIIHDTQDILRSEIRLAATEVREELVKARSASVLVAAGVLGAIFMVLFALLTCVFALALVIPMWAATLCVAVAVGVVGIGTVSAGIRRFKAIRAVPKSVATMKETFVWPRRQIK